MIHRIRIYQRLLTSLQKNRSGNYEKSKGLFQKRPTADLLMGLKTTQVLTLIFGRSVGLQVFNWTPLCQNKLDKRHSKQT